MYRLLYNLALIVASPFLALMLLRRLAKGKSRAGWSERWGHIPESIANLGKPRIWVHAASVGEVAAAEPILKLLRERLPNYSIVVSVITPGGHETATKLIGKSIDVVIYAPFDMPWSVSRAVKSIQPSALVILETELWPNLISSTRRAGARIILVNGRLSDRSFPRYRRFKGLFRWTMRLFDRVLVQSKYDEAKFFVLGVPHDRMVVMGSVKFDQPTGKLSPEEAATLRHSLNLPDGAPTMVIGSTRQADEEDIVLKAVSRIRQQIPELAIVHAPRHVERAGELCEMMRSFGMTPVRRTEQSSDGLPAKEIVLDTYGELERVYAVGDIAFIGNSLVPPGGGQNLIQPIAQGKPVLHGPLMSNFRDIASLCRSVGVAFTVRGSDELAREAIRLIQDTETRNAIAQSAEKVVAENRGAAARYAQAILECLGAD